MTQAPQPRHVELKSEEGILSMEWSDGVHTDFSLRYLRGWCPCAGCQGHFNGAMMFIEGNTTLIDVEPVGGYAMRLHWLDDHKSGIFSFKYLREIYEQPPGDGITNQQMLLDDKEDREALEDEGV